MRLLCFLPARRGIINSLRLKRYVMRSRTFHRQMRFSEQSSLKDAHWFSAGIRGGRCGEASARVAARAQTEEPEEAASFA